MDSTESLNSDAAGKPGRYEDFGGLRDINLSAFIRRSFGALSVIASHCSIKGSAVLLRRWI